MDSLSTRTADRQCRSPHIGFHARGSRKPVHTGRADTRSGPAKGVGGSPSPLLGSPPEGTATFTHGARERRGEPSATCERTADGARGPTVPTVTVIRPALRIRIARIGPKTSFARSPCGSGSRRMPLRTHRFPTCKGETRGTENAPQRRQKTRPSRVHTRAPNARQRRPHTLISGILRARLSPA